MNGKLRLQKWAHRSRGLIAATVSSLLLVACGGGGGGYDSGSSPPPAAAITIAATPATITQGQSTTLTWSSNGSSCTASGAWSGVQNATGTLSVSPATVGANIYTLTCAGSLYSSSSAATTVTVSAASAFSKSNLISDGSTPAVHTDAKLINPWGIAFGPTTPVWVANNGSQSSTLYDGTGTVVALVVNVPAGVSGNASPTGIVFNGTSTDFTVSNGTTTAGSVFIFDGEGGTISGWSPTVNGTNAIVKYDDTNGAVFKGLAIANNGTANFLYAADFHNNKVLVFDRTFTKVTVAGGFIDPTLPAGYAPFGVRALQVQGQTQIFVTYAKQDATAHDDVAGAGLGLVNVFDTSGTLVKHLVTTGGALNAPWGLALAPANFGTLSNQLLIGNFGDGVINAYDSSTGAFAGAIKDSTGASIAIPGLWGIAFGNGARNQPTTTLYFAAGINSEAGGLYGRIDLGATAPDIVAPTVSLTAPAAASSATGNVTVTANAADNVGVTQVQFFAGATAIGTATTAPFTISWNSVATPNGSVNLTAQAKDAAGNLTTSAAVSVTVANAPVSFATLYTQIFASTGTGHCVNCHTGGGASLPASMNLSSAASAYAAFVGVTSVESTLQRVKVGDPANSYVINKLEGTAGITGGRMPAGGPFLDQPTIDTVKAWITQGAANN